MDKKQAELLEQLRKLGWRINASPARRALPGAVTDRYPWMPTDYRALVEEMAMVCSPDEKAWFLTEADFAGTSGSAYAWNEWEQQSLEAAGSDEAWKAAIVSFWDNHLSILFSTRSGYAFFALEKDGLGVVYGEEPEYEETTPIAGSLTEFLRMVVDKHPQLARFL
jgi:hypothetical protein